MSNTRFSRQSPTFPPEIFKEILDHLAASLDEDDEAEEEEGDPDDYTHNCLYLKTEMKTMALVCKDFLYSCRPYIFRDIELDIRQNDDQTQSNTARLSSLALLLKEQPRISRSVKHITMFCDDEQSLWHNKDGALTSLFQLPSVSSMRIIRDHDDDSNQDITNGSLERPSGARSALTSDDVRTVLNWEALLGRYLCYGSLTSVYLEGVSPVPLVQLLSTPSLKELVLKGNCRVGYEDIEQISLPSPLQGFSLETFCAPLDNCTPLWAVWNCENLEYASFRCPFISIDDLPKMPLKSDDGYLPFQKLKVVKIHSYTLLNYGPFFHAAEEKDQIAFPNLEELTMSLEIGGDDDELERTEEYEAEIERMLEHAPRLKKLVLLGDTVKAVLGQSLRSSLSSLTHLTLTWGFFLDSDHKFGPTLPTAINDLCAVQLPWLEKLRIFIGIKDVDVADAEVSVSDLDVLMPLFLDSADILPCLKELTVQIKFYISDSIDYSSEDQKRARETLSDLYLARLGNLTVGPGRRNGLRGILEIFTDSITDYVGY